MLEKYVNLVDIGEISPKTPQSWSETFALVHTFEGIYRNFDIFLVENDDL